MEKSLLFVEPAMIGKVVTIQVFKREEDDSDSLESKSLMKYVGVLKAYSIDPNGTFSFKIDGFQNWWQYSPKTHYVEIFVFDEKPEPKSYKGPADYGFDEIILENRSDAEEIMDRLTETIRVYGEASVADLYEMVGVTGKFIDNHFGWKTLAGSRLIRVRQGYTLSLPKPESIKKS